MCRVGSTAIRRSDSISIFPGEDTAAGGAVRTGGAGGGGAGWGGTGGAGGGAGGGGGGAGGGGGGGAALISGRGAAGVSFSFRLA
jgi:hypothetical protein